MTSKSASLSVLNTAAVQVQPSRCLSRGDVATKQCPAWHLYLRASSLVRVASRELGFVSSRAQLIQKPMWMWPALYQNLYFRLFYNFSGWFKPDQATSL